MRAEAEVDLVAIEQNYQQVRAQGFPVMPVVKADAYGHGVSDVAPLLRSLGAQWLGVALPSEALALRGEGDGGHILAWLWTPGDPAVPECIARHVDISVSSVWALEEVAQAASRAGETARIHIKVDTGLTRNGAEEATWLALLGRARTLQDRNQVRIVGLWSHLGSADESDRKRTDDQLATFQSALQAAESVGVRPEIRHIANSAAALTRRDAGLDMVRVGIALYGLTPGWSMGSAADLGLRPAMTLRTRLAHVKAVPKGTAVSYGRGWMTPADTVVGLVPIGYADGVPRAATNRVSVLVNDRLRPVIGQVAMDQFVVDLGGDDCRSGDNVVCFGPGFAGEQTADDWARSMDTIGYEIVTRIEIGRAHV